MTALSIRPALLEDAPAVAGLIALLGHKIDTATVAGHLGALDRTEEPQLLAIADSQIVGLCGLHRMIAVHRDRPVGRITILVVREDCRGNGIGRALVNASVAHFRQSGCELLEVTSNDRLIEAHSFYTHLGFERTSRRFALPLG